MAALTVPFIGRRIGGRDCTCHGCIGDYKLRTMRALIFLSWIACTVAVCRAADSGFAKMKVGEFFSPGPYTELAEAAARGNGQKIAELIERGVDVNVTGKDGVTPLLWALLKGSKPGFKQLLERGANPNLQIKHGDSVLAFAAMERDSEFLRLALKHGGDPNLINPRTGKTPLFDSLDHLRFNNISVLIEGGADLNFRDKTGVTPVMQAAALNQYQVVHAMLKAGADPTIKNNFGNTIAFYLKTGNLDPKHELYQWRAKVAALLEERGMKVD